jgi:hypothetical protein
MSHAGVGEGVEGGGGPVWACRSGAKPIHLGLLLLAFKVGVFGLDMDIVVHIVVGILWGENRFGCRFERIDVVMQIVVVNYIGW